MLLNHPFRSVLLLLLPSLEAECSSKEPLNHGSVHLALKKENDKSQQYPTIF